MSEDKNRIWKRFICVCLLVAMILGMALMTACKSPETAEEGGVQAADPLTPEEQATDDSGGCIEDSEDLLN